MKITRGAPLYRQIADGLREDIFCNRRPGDELPGDNELSKSLNISSLTVREAMSVLGEEGLIDRRVGSGTRVAKPRIGRNQVVAVLIDKDLTDSAFPAHYLPRYEHIRRRFSKAGIQAALYTGILSLTEFPQNISSTDFIRDLRGGKIAAVVSLLGFPEDQHLQYAALRNIPWLHFGPTNSASLKIDLNMEMALDELTAELAKQGKNKIALLGWHGSWNTKQCYNERVNWFKKAVKKHSMVSRPEWIRMDIYPALPGAGWSQIRTLWSSSSEKPDAVIFLDDCLFIDAIPALERIGIAIPRDLAIGVFTHRMSAIRPQFPVTFASVSLEEISETVYNYIFSCLETGDVQKVQHQYSATIWPPEEASETDEVSHSTGATNMSQAPVLP